MSLPVLDTIALRRAGRELKVPFELQLNSGARILIEEIFRLLPKKRLAAKGKFEGKTVLAKVFFSRHGARRHFKREKNGLLLLKNCRLPAPSMLGSYELKEKGCYLLLIEFLSQSEKLGQKWRGVINEKPEGPSQLALLEPLFTLVGSMHATGLGQKDLHLDNFLFHEGVLKIIDGDAIFPCSTPSRQAENLGLLMAQLPRPIVAALQTPLLEAYRKSHSSSSITSEQLTLATNKQRDKRLRAYLGKTLRDCTEFSSKKAPCRFVSMVRSEASWLNRFLKNLDQAMDSGVPLKLGNSCTLAHLELSGHQVVVKRYNTVNFMRYLRRCWRRSRAMKSWLHGHRLNFLGIPTPQPLALVEERMFLLRGRAWLVCEHVQGDHLLAFLEKYNDSDPPTTLLNALKNLFTAMYEARISHGDMKGTNFLWDGHRIFLVDLDAVRAHRREFTFKRAWERDRRRFLKNWKAGSKAKKYFSDIFPN